MNHMMEPYFWVGDDLQDFLFKGLNTKSWAGLLGLCVCLTSLALAYEGLHVLKTFFLSRFIKSSQEGRRRRSGTTGSESMISRSRHQGQGDAAEPAPRSLLEESDSHDSGESVIRVTSRKRFLDLGISSVLHALYMFLGFTLMNAVMTFNVWVLVAICFGVAGGYFCFGTYRKEENLIRPICQTVTETTSVDDNDITPPLLPQSDGSGDGNGVGPSFGRSRNARSYRDASPDGSEECSKLIVGAQVHIVSSSASPN